MERQRPISCQKLGFALVLILEDCALLTAVAFAEARDLDDVLSELWQRLPLQMPTQSDKPACRIASGTHLL